MSSTLAYSTAIARLYKSFVLTRGVVNELLTMTDWRDAANLLKDRGYISEVPATIEAVEKLLKQRAINFLTKIRRYVSNTKVNADILDLYIYLFSLNELETLISSTITGSKPSNNFLLIKDLAEANPQTIDDLLNFSKGIISEGLKFALGKSSKKTPSEINSLAEFYFINKLTKIVSEFRGDWKSKAEDIICTYKDYYSIMLAYKLHIVEGITCKIDESILKDISAARNDKEIIDIMARTIYAKKLDLNNVYEALSSLYHLARVNSRKSSLEAFMGSPFTPVTTLAIAELIRLDYEDLTMIINGIKLGISEKVKKMTSFELI
mgnify:CR=1 FL=1